MLKPKRTYLVCKSKNCAEAKLSRVRCTLSFATSAQGSVMGEYLNSRNFCVLYAVPEIVKNANTPNWVCVLYAVPEIVKNANTPNWVATPDKPGLRKQTERTEKESEIDYDLLDIL